MAPLGVPQVSLLGPYFLGIPGGAVGRPSPCCTTAFMALPCRGTTAPKALCVRGCFGFSPGLSAAVMLQGRLETLALLWHEKQGARGQSEGKLVFHTSAPLRVVVVFIRQAEMQEHDREWCHKTWPFSFGLQGPRALEGSPGLAALVETTQQKDVATQGPRMLSSH